MGYTSPAESGILDDLGLTLAEVNVDKQLVNVKFDIIFFKVTCVKNPRLSNDIANA